MVMVAVSYSLENISSFFSSRQDSCSWLIKKVLSIVAFSLSPSSSSFKSGLSACFPGPNVPFLQVHSFPLPPVLLQKFLKFHFAFNMQIHLNYLKFSIFWCFQRESYLRDFLHVFSYQFLSNLVLKIVRVKFIVN